MCQGDAGEKSFCRHDFGSLALGFRCRPVAEGGRGGGGAFEVYGLVFRL